MKKFDFKTRMQWGWFKAALFGAAVAVLIVPAAGNISGNTDSKTERENPILSVINSISFGPKVKVMLNGDVVALAKSEEAAQEAYKTARLAYNADGVRILNVDFTYEEVDKEKDAETVKGMKTLRGDSLTDAILDSFDKYGTSGKETAYTMRIDDYTVTLDSMEDVISILEQAQGRYDTEDAFQVGLKQPASHNVTMYEVNVEQKASKQEKSEDGNSETAAESSEAVTENPEVTTESSDTAAESSESKTESSEITTESETTEQKSETEGAIYNIPKKQVVNLTGAEPDGNGESEEETQPADNGGANAEESQPEDESGENAEEEPQESADTENDTEDAQVQQVSAEVAAQAVNDGVKYVGFSETIQVMETYVTKDQIKDKDTAYNEITAENEEESIYVVAEGDCLSVIAEKNNMSVDQIKELNPDIESDDNIYYGDRLNVTIPKAAVQILVEKQETYEESYNEDVVYEDDDSMYIGETEVVQEGTPGKHIVTDLVTYKGDIESGREQLQENVQVAAVAQIVRRGTKSKPTYMYPVTNWNITSNFGYRWGRLHAGTDVGIPTGTTVRASRGGQVITAGWLGGYGNCVIIDHGDGVSTRYGHLSEITVSVGQYVDQGQQIALSGNTGRSTGPHLHFEIRIGGEAVDPMPYLTQSN